MREEEGAEEVGAVERGEANGCELRGWQDGGCAGVVDEDVDLKVREVGCEGFGEGAHAGEVAGVES